MSIVNGTVTTKTEGGVTYGISISDLQKATNSAKRDLMLLHCESVNGLGIAEVEEGITNGTQTIKSAFSLRDMPLPNGWSRLNNVTSKKGDLVMHQNDLTKEIAVAKPRWNLWADNVNFGKFVLRDTTSGNYYFEYNIFQPFNGAGMPNLQQWQGYNPNNVHEPSFKITGFPDNNNNGYVNLEFHNGVYADLKNSQKRFPVDSSYADDKTIFIEDRSVLAYCKMSLGNLVDWDSMYGINPSNSVRLATKSGDAYTFDSNGLAIYGVSAVSTINKGAGSALDVASAVERENDALTYTSSSAIKNKYRGSIDSTLEYRCDYGGALYNMMNAAENHIKPATTQLSLVRTPANNPQVLYVSTERVLPTSSDVVFKSTNDEKRSQTGSNLRVIFNNGGKVKINGTDYVVCWANGSDSGSFNVAQIGDQVVDGVTYYGGLNMYVFLYNPINGTVLSTDRLGAMVEMTTTDSDGNIGYYRRMYLDCPKWSGFDNSTLRSKFLIPNTYHPCEDSKAPNGTKLENLITSGVVKDYVHLLLATAPSTGGGTMDFSTSLNIENSTLIVSFYDKGSNASIDFTSLDYTSGACGKTYRNNGFSFDNTSCFIMWQKNMYSASRSADVYDLGYIVPATNTTSLTTRFDFTIYGNATSANSAPNPKPDAVGTVKVVLRNHGQVVNQSVSETRGYTNVTINGSSATMLDSNGQSFIVSIKTYDNGGVTRPAVTYDGWYKATANCHSLKVNGLKIRPSDSYTFSIEP